MVTGSSGLVGSVVAERLIARGDEPVFVDIRSRWGPADILDPDALNAAMAGVDGVIHLAAVSRVAWGEQNAEFCTRVNVDGTRRVLEAALAAQKKPWVVFASSREVYGNVSTDRVAEGCPKNPVNRYGLSKLGAEAVVDAAAAETGLATSILRLSSVYGGRHDHPDRAVPSLTWRAIAGEPLVITGAETFFDFVHVGDTVDGLLAAADCLAAEKRGLPPVNLATGVSTTLRGLAENVLSATSSASALRISAARVFDVSGYCGANERALGYLGWVPRIGLSAGIAGVVEDMRRNGPLAPVLPPWLAGEPGEAERLQAKPNPADYLRAS